MKSLFKFFLVATAITLSPQLHAQSPNMVTGDALSGGQQLRNYVKNPSARTSTAFTAVSSAAVARDTDTADKIDGVASFTCDASSQGGYCEWQTFAIQEGDKTGSCEVSLSFKGDATLYRVQVYDGSSATSVSDVLTNESDWKEVKAAYACGSTRTIRVTQTESGTAPAINVARVNWSKATNIGTVAQAVVIGDVSFDSTCSFASGATSTTPTNYSADASCGTTVTGGASIVGTTRPAISFASRGPGYYQARYIGATIRSYTSNAECYWRFSDGTTGWGAQGGASYAFDGSSTLSTSSGIEGGIYYASPSGTITLDIQHYSSSGTGNGCDLRPAASGQTNKIIVTYFPTVSQAVVRADQTNYPPTAFTPSTVGSQGFGTIAAESCTHARDAKWMIVNCRITAGTVAASEARITLPGGNTVSSEVTSLRLAEGYWVRSNASSNSVKRGTILMNGGLAYVNFSVDEYAATRNPLVAQLGSDVFSNSDVISLYFKVPIQAWRDNGKAPQFYNSVVCLLDGTCQIAAGRLTNNGSICAVASELGDSLGACTRNGNGDITQAFTTAFSSAPFCTCSSESTTFTVCTLEPGETTTSSVGLVTVNPNVARGDGTLQFFCIGQK